MHKRSAERFLQKSKSTFDQPRSILFSFAFLIAGLSVLMMISGAASVQANATGLTPTHRVEIDHLLRYIESSSCLFRRNGEWYGARDAANHIRGKYRYLTDRGKIESTEDFIEKSASRSSLSGRLYLVRCGQKESASSQWLSEELERFRQSGHSKESTGS